MSILKERLGEALEARKNDINSFIWKGEKVEVNGKFVQNEVRLVDCNEETLQRHYNYCKQMLYNNDKSKPGRYILLSIISDQINRCNCELFFRWLKTAYQKDRFAFVSEIKKVIEKNPSVSNDLKEYPISGLVNGIPSEFANLPVSLVIDGGLDKLGKFDKQHITLTFILKQGVWFTSEELKALTITDENGVVRDRLEVVKENLALKSNLPLRVTPKGLSYAQLRSMTTLKSKKYAELTTDQLQLLRNRMLFALEDDCRFHISQWESRMEQILMVAEAKGYTINKDA